MSETKLNQGLSGFPEGWSAEDADDLLTKGQVVGAMLAGKGLRNDIQKHSARQSIRTAGISKNR